MISRSQTIVSVNNDKTGYALTAGSYSVIKSIQHVEGSTTVANGYTGVITINISSVTTSKAMILNKQYGGLVKNGAVDNRFAINSGPYFGSATTVVYTVDSNQSNGAATFYWSFTVVEFW